MNRDPIAEKGGVNLYAFVNNAAIDAFDPLGLRLDNGGLSQKPLNSIVSDPRFRSTWQSGQLGGTLQTNFSKMYSITGSDSVIEYDDPSQPNGMTHCARIQTAAELSVRTFAVVANDQLNRLYTANGLSAIIAHEQRRLDSVVNGYNATIEVYNQNRVPSGKSLCTCVQGRAKARLEKWLERFRESAKSKFENYVNSEAQAVSDENSHHLDASGHSISIPGPNSLIDHTDSAFIQPAGNIRNMEVPSWPPTGTSILWPR